MSKQQNPSYSSSSNTVGDNNQQQSIQSHQHQHLTATPIKQKLTQVQIGLAFFSPQIHKLTLNSILENKLLLFEQTIWQQTSQNFQQRYQILLQYMTRTTNTEIRLFVGDLNQTFFTQIRHIHFENLIHLNLLSNYITNIQGLVFLNAPHLKKLGLGNNQIVNISKTLSKMYFNQITQIDFYGNQVIEADLGRLQVHNSQLSFRCKSCSQKLIFSIENLSFYAKAMIENQNKKIDYFQYYIKQSDQRKHNSILQPRCVMALKGKKKVPSDRQNQQNIERNE